MPHFSEAPHGAPQLYQSHDQAAARDRFDSTTQRQSTTTDRLRISNNQDAYLRRLFQRSEDLPWQGVFLNEFNSISPCPGGKQARQPPTPPAKSSLCVKGDILSGQKKMDMVNLLVFFEIYRASCTSVATAGSSASRMESPNPSSSSARTLAGYPGLSCTVASTRRVSLKSVPPVPFCFRVLNGWFPGRGGIRRNIDAHMFRYRTGQA